MEFVVFGEDWGTPPIQQPAFATVDRPRVRCPLGQLHWPAPADFHPEGSQAGMGKVVRGRESQGS